MPEFEQVGEVVVLVQSLIEQLVMRPELVKVLVGRGDHCVLLDVRVAPADRGRVIGQGGDTVRSLQTIVRRFGRGQVRYELNVLRNHEGMVQ